MATTTKLWLAGTFLVLFLLPLGLIVRSAAVGQTSAPIKESVVNQAPKLPSSIPPQAAQPQSTAPASTKLIIGDPDASLTLIEYGDFQCPFCAQFFRQTEPSIIKDYVNTGKVKIEFRIETHIGDESAAAGQAAYCANDQGKFKAYHDALFTRQNGENNGAFNSVNLKEIAVDVGLETSKFEDCFNTGKYTDAVRSSNAEAKERGVSSTPTIFIGSNKVSGAQPYAIYKQLLEAEL